MSPDTLTEDRAALRASLDDMAKLIGQQRQTINVVRTTCKMLRRAI